MRNDENKHKLKTQKIVEPTQNIQFLKKIYTTDNSVSIINQKRKKKYK